MYFAGCTGNTLVAFLFGFTFLLGLLDPCGAYGRIVTHVFRPAYLAGSNLLESIFTSFGNHTFYRVSIYNLSVFPPSQRWLHCSLSGF